MTGDVVLVGDRTVRGAVALALAAMAGPAPGAGAAGEDVVAYTAAGERVFVGTVLARGAPVGDGCVFSGPVTLRLETSGAVARMSTRADCSVVVTQLGMAESDPGRMVPSGVPRPATEDPPFGAARGGRGIEAVVADHAPATPDGGEPRYGVVWQRAYDPQENVQALVQFEVDFTRQRDGDLTKAWARPGECHANAFPLLVPGTAAVATTETTSCHGALPSRGPFVVDRTGSGTFRHSALGQELVTFRLGGRFMAYAAYTYPSIWTCKVEVVSGRWPFGWTTECEGRELRRGAA